MNYHNKENANENKILKNFLYYFKNRCVEMVSDENK